MNRMESIRREIEEKYYIVKEINFNEDIDIERSDKHILDEKNNYLEFLFREIENISPESYTAVLGKSKTVGNGIKMIPTINNDLINDNKKRATFLVEKPLIQNQVDLVCVNFQRSYSAYFYFFISNHIYHNTMEKIIRREIPYNSEVFISSGSRHINNVFGDNIVTIQTRTDSIPDLDSALTIPIQNNCDRFLINLKDNYIKLQEKKYNAPYSSFIKKEKVYISLACIPYDSSMENESVLVKSVVYGSRNGLVYLKPFLLKSSKLKVFMICSGNPTIQSYSKKIGKWINITSNNISDSGAEIHLRIKMSLGDKIYHFLIVENK